MEPNPEVSTLYRIVNHFQSLQYIQPQILKIMQQSKRQDLSCYIGLMNLLYHLTIQYKDKGRPKSKDQSRKNSYPSQNLYQERNTGNILHIRGQIFKQYGKFLNKIFYKPANELARFNYQQFNKFCNDHGFSQLVRHTRGIYPVIDSKTHRPLQFLSLYKQFLQNGELLIGNPSWELARKTVKKYYQQEIKGNMEDEKSMGLLNLSEYAVQQQEQLEQNKKDKQKNNYDLQVMKGVRLSYILLTQQYMQLQEYINQFQQKFVKNYQGSKDNLKNNKQMLDRLRFWFNNYFPFVHQGLQMYRSTTSNTKLPPVVYNFNVNYFEDLIIDLIENLFNLVTNKDQKQLNQLTKLDLKAKINKLSEMVSDNSIIEKDIDKMLILSYIHVVYKVLFPNEQAYDSSKSIYIKLKTNKNPLEQPYNRIFFSDKQLLKLYEDGHITQFPSCSQYTSQISQQILKLLIQKNPQKIFKYFSKINILEPYDRLNVILDSKLIGDVKVTKSFQQNESQRLLFQLQKMAAQDQYKKVLRNQEGRQFGIADAAKSATSIFKNYIEAWRKYYNFNQNFNEEYLKEFLLKFKQSQTQRFKNQQNKKQQRKYLIPSDFIAPYRRKDCYYHFIKKIVKKVQEQIQTFTRILQLQDRRNDNSLANISQKLTKFLKTFMTSQFKTILSLANTSQNSKSNQDLMEQQNQVSQKQKFEDHVWQVYAQVYLLLNQFSKKLIQNDQQKKSQFIKKSAPPVNFSKQYQKHQAPPQYTEIQIDDD